MNAVELFDLHLLDEMLDGGFVRCQRHPELPLRILNYSEKAAYDRIWNEVTLQCRGLILDENGDVVARPFRKFFNWGEHQEPVQYDKTTHRKVYPESDIQHALDLDASVVVTDKLDGSMGELYPTPDGYAIATRGSFISEQALHATEVWRDRYANVFTPLHGCTYIFEILYPTNRIVVDYKGLDDLVLLDVLDNESGLPAADGGWPGPRTETFSYANFAAALAAAPRANAEGLVIYFEDLDLRLKLKQDDYVALHRILTGTNARHVWEVAAVQACVDIIRERKHWGSFLGIDPARAEEIVALGDDWLDGVPDEFYSWIESVSTDAETCAHKAIWEMTGLAERLSMIEDRRKRFEAVQRDGGAFQLEVMRLASGGGADALERLKLRAWREAEPEPTTPYAFSEDVA